MNKTLFFAILILSGLTLFSCKNKKQKAPTPKTEVAVDTVAADTTSQEEYIEPDPLDELAKEEEPEPEPVDNRPMRYFLIAESFEIHENALKCKQELEAKGYISDIIDLPEGINAHYYRVSYKAFADFTEAINELNLDRQSDEFSDVWVLTK